MDARKPAPVDVVVIGAGNVGYNAAWIAAGMLANVTIMDRNLDRLRHLEQIAVGKTTTIGKLATRLRGEGKKLLLAAGDTFRAAAIEQL